jgi:hypothetical protein
MTEKSTELIQLINFIPQGKKGKFLEECYNQTLKAAEMGLMQARGGGNKEIVYDNTRNFMLYSTDFLFFHEPQKITAYIDIPIRRLKNYIDENGLLDFVEKNRLEFEELLVCLLEISFLDQIETNETFSEYKDLFSNL